MRRAQIDRLPFASVTRQPAYPSQDANRVLRISNMARDISYLSISHAHAFLETGIAFAYSMHAHRGQIMRHLSAFLSASSVANRHLTYL